MERDFRCVWRNTPTPPPEERARILAEYEAKEAEERRVREAAEAAAAEAAARAAAKTAAEANAAAAALADDDTLRELAAAEAALFTAWLAAHRRAEAEAAATQAAAEEEDRLVGPAPPPGGAVPEDYGIEADYGTHLRPGEGTAMAAFVQQGQRIPRRGEVGLDSDQIERYEQAGYVMSGSRHGRMNAVRIRKENQVYTAEEKAALAMFNFEENKRKEAQILEEMRRLVDRTLGPAVGGGEGGSGGDQGAGGS